MKGILSSDVVAVVYKRKGDLEFFGCLKNVDLFLTYVLLIT